MKVWFFFFFFDYKLLKLLLEECLMYFKVKKDQLLCYIIWWWILLGLYYCYKRRTKRLNVKSNLLIISIFYFLSFKQQSMCLISLLSCFLKSLVRYFFSFWSLLYFSQKKFGKEKKRLIFWLFYFYFNFFWH